MSSVFKACSNERMEEEPVKSREMMEEELETDKQDETHPLTSGKKAEV